MKCWSRISVLKQMLGICALMLIGYPLNGISIEQNEFILSGNKIGTIDLNPDSDVSNFTETVFDNNPDTSWTSKAVKTALVVVIPLSDQFQITSITCNVGKSTSQQIVIERQSGNSWDSTPWVSLDPRKESISWTYAFGDSIKSRTAYLKSLTNSLRFTFEPVPLSRSITINDIVIKARYSCFNNSDSVDEEKDGTYRCNCEATTKTSGKFCDICEPKSYRDSDSLVCSGTPLCSESGTEERNGRFRKVIGGECYCKKNVEGTECDKCTYWNYNLNAANDKGCLPCGCDVEGSISCNNETGACSCRPRVKPALCVECSEPNNYGRNRTDGCIACDCSQAGSQNSSCHEFSGQCHCKKFVEGLKCDKCKAEFWDLQLERNFGCQSCDCNIVGVINENLICDRQTGQCPCRVKVNNRECKQEIDSIVPKYGPVAGGTEVTITGRLFGVKDKYLPIIKLGDVVQLIDSRRSNDTTIIFITRASSTEETMAMSIKWTNNLVDGSGYEFEYRANPQIISVNMMKSFASGGCKFNITSKDMSNVYKPVVTFDGNQFPENIYNTNDGFGIISPPSDSNIPMNSTKKLFVGLILDGFTEYNKLHDKFPNGVLYVKNDPDVNDQQFFIFENPFSDIIKLQGNGFTQACNEQDFSVTVNLQDKEWVCRIVSIKSTEIVCSLKHVPWDLSGKYNIKVQIGYFSKVIGKVEFLGFWNTKKFIYIAVGAALFVVLCLVITVIACCCYHRRRRKGAKRDEAELITMEGKSSPDGIQNSSYEGLRRSHANKYSIMPSPHRDSIIAVSDEDIDWFVAGLDPSIQNSVKNAVVKSRHIELDNKCLCQGTISCVLEGYYKIGTQKKVMDIKLPIKPLPDNEDLPPWVSSTLREWLKFQDYSNANVIDFYGMSLDKEKFFLLYPNMPNGTLKDFVSKNQNFDTKKIMLDIARGMAYLASQGFTHKDLAARNCMVDGALCVKISDSAFSWDLYPHEYKLDKSRNKYLPVRWMAIESLVQEGFYSEKTDVWSFGVVSWEVLTRGDFPYQGAEDFNILKTVRDNRQRLALPKSTPKDLATLIKSCWRSDGLNRQSFDQIVALMEGRTSYPMIPQATSALSMQDEQDESFYVNKDAIQALRKTK